MQVDRGRRVRFIVSAVAVAAAVSVAIVMTPRVARADRRAYPIDLPSGDRFYIYTEGGSDFPNDHKLEIWHETNGLLACSTTQGLPLGHYTEADGESGLQRVRITCDGRVWEPDTRLIPPAEEAPPPPPPPTPTASPSPSPSAEGTVEPAEEPSEPALMPPSAPALAQALTDPADASDPAVITIGHDTAERLGVQQPKRGFGTGFLAVVMLAIGAGSERAWKRVRAR